MSGERETDTRWYGRRRGKKLRPGRQALVESLLPKIRLTPPPGGEIASLADCFSHAPAAVWLEIGFGAGEHLAALALAHPEIGFIGCEPFVNGVAALLSRIDGEGIDNVRIFDDDARLLFEALPDAAIGRLFVLFSDPWPKKRHSRRRLITDDTLDQFARVLDDGAEFRFASDHKDYVRWTLEHVLRHPNFSWPAEARADWSEPPADWIRTRYEAKAISRGERPAYLRLLRRSR